MKIIEKLNAKQDIYGGKPVTIAFFGDSVTQGCFECDINQGGEIVTVFDYKSAYSTRIREMLNILYPQVQVNIIDSGTSGDNTTNARDRIDRDITPFSPDLVVVSFGLNDSCSGLDALDKYADNLRFILNKVASNGAEVIFLTQNAMNTKISYSMKEENVLLHTARITENVQNSGILRAYMNKAKEIASECGAKVCDIYPMWEKLIAGGVDTTELLANKINHPIREIHYYMAMKLIETMFE